MVDTLTPELLAKFHNEGLNNHPQVLREAIAQNGIEIVAYNRSIAVKQKRNIFSHEIDTGKITYQRSSGRCWIFAGLNMLREKISKKINVKDFELSQNYLMFWDKLEKANFFLNNIIETADRPLDDRLVMWLLTAPVQDGGQWDMFVGLVKKYGVVPIAAMPESFSSSNSRTMNHLLTRRLRKGAKELRDAVVAQEDLAPVREKIIGEIYHMLLSFLGEPPTDFTLEYRDDDHGFHRVSDLTPHSFYDQYLDDLKLEDYVSVINAPTEDKPFFQTFTVDYLTSVTEGQPIKYLNLPIEDLKDLSIKQLKDQEGVWFGCEVGKMSHRPEGTMAFDLYLFREALGVDLSIEKGDQLNYGESLLTHAMMFTGVNITDDDARPNRWKVENSWGEKNCQDGFFVMSDHWFSEYLYEVVIHKKHLTEGQLKGLETEPKHLHPWDPMGSLA